MDFPTYLASTRWPAFPNVSILRGDQIHPIVSGNKLFKLSPFLRAAQASEAVPLISVGGRFSNHLHALAFAGYEMNLQTLGLVRGFENQVETPTLRDCRDWGMTIQFIRPEHYKSRYANTFWEPWLARFPNAMRIDEGGWSSSAIEASQTWWDYISPETDIVIVPVGSGSTLAGIVKGAPKGIRVIGVPSFKDSTNYAALRAQLAAVGVEETQYELWTEFLDTGFGKLSEEVKQFKFRFESLTDIPLDVVYTAKMLFAVEKMLLSRPALQQKTITAIHTGGLQGNRSAN